MTNELFVITQREDFESLVDAIRQTRDPTYSPTKPGQLPM